MYFYSNSPGTIVSNVARRGPRGYHDEEDYKKVY